MTEFIRVPADSAGKRVNVDLSNDGVNDIYTQVIHLADRDNPNQLQIVDNAGAAKVAFDKGSPDFAVFGRMTVTEGNLLGMYKFYQKEYLAEFQKTETLGGTAAQDLAQLGFTLTTNTLSGSLASYFSHRHYIYKPGAGMPLMFTYKIGDPGKVNLERYIGWFGNEGAIQVCFCHDSIGLSCVLKDAALGIDIGIPKAAWSGDRLDGSGGVNNLSGALYDASKNNIWWIDFQFLSAGVIRWGTYINGVKVTCHEEGNYNARSTPWASNTSLSFGFAQVNTGVTASSSEMTVFCAVVTNEGYDEFDKNMLSFSSDVTLTTTSFVPVLSYRPAQLKSGFTNRARVAPISVSAIAVGGAVELIAEVNTQLIAPTWNSSIGAVEYDTDATAISQNGLRKAGQFVHDQGELTNLSDVFPLQTSGVTRHFDPTNYDHVTILARLIQPGSALFGVTLTVAEVE